MPVAQNSSQLMTCMEVWGGNDIADRNIEMLGLDAWIFARPFGASTHGGDVYYISSCATGRILRLLVADVSGHGQSVKMPAEKLRSLMRRYVNHIDQKRFVKAMNLALTEFFTGGKFATAVVATYFAPTQTLTLTNAGHPAPLYFDAKTSSWRFLQTQQKNHTHPKQPTDIPLGIMGLSDYATQSLRVHSGDLIICYTDALLECKDAQGKLLGEQGLKEMLTTIPHDNPSQIIPKLIGNLQALYPGNLEDDDLTILLFTPNLLFKTLYKTPNTKKYLEIMANLSRKMFTRGEAVPWPDLHPANIGGAMYGRLSKLWGRKLK